MIKPCKSVILLFLTCRLLAQDNEMEKTPEWMTYTQLERIVIACREICYDVDLIMQIDQSGALFQDSYNYLAQKVLTLYQAFERLSADHREIKTFFSEDICYLQAALTRVTAALMRLIDRTGSDDAMRATLLVDLLDQAQQFVVIIQRNGLEGDMQEMHCQKFH